MKLAQNIRERYLNQAGASRVIQGGRMESENNTNRGKREGSARQERRLRPNQKNLEMYR
jgi:hypothetical protein